MKVTRTLGSGADGSDRYQRTYGGRMVCVRYRRDPRSGHRLNTVEWVAAAAHSAHPQSTVQLHGRTHLDRFVHRRVGFHERTLRAQVKAAGRTWFAPK